jgi:hypothetical protein
VQTDNIKNFQQNKFVVIPNFLDPYLLAFLVSYFEHAKENPGPYVGQDWTSANAHGDACADSVMYSLRPIIEAITGLELLPTYSWVRMYNKGDTLGRHKDVAANQVSCNVCISKDIDWLLGLSDGENEFEISLEPGDAVIYDGVALEHWRDKYQGQNQIQMIVGYVVKGGEFDADRFYGREKPMYIPSAVKREGPLTLIKGFLFRRREDYRKIIKSISG